LFDLELDEEETTHVQLKGKMSNCPLTKEGYKVAFQLVLSAAAMATVQWQQWQLAQSQWQFCYYLLYLLYLL
jgi:hypothetical protein